MESYILLSKALSSLKEVRAITIAGSRRSLIYDNASDYDIYIYSDAHIDKSIRETLLKDIGVCRIDCSPFEEGDEITPPEGPYLDLMYRDTSWAENEIDWVWRKHNARVGYSTCFLKSMRDAEVLYSRDGWYEKLQDELISEYPEGLKRNIINKNMDFIDGNGKATCIHQVEVAVLRHDKFAMAERTCTLLSSLFDSLYAFSGIMHPGEKKNLRYLKEYKVIMPPTFLSDVEEVLKNTQNEESLIPLIKKLVKETEETIGYEK